MKLKWFRVRTEKIWCQKLFEVRGHFLLQWDSPHCLSFYSSLVSFHVGRRISWLQNEA